MSSHPSGVFTGFVIVCGGVDSGHDGTNSSGEPTPEPCFRLALTVVSEALLLTATHDAASFHRAMRLSDHGVLIFMAVLLVIDHNPVPDLSQARGLEPCWKKER